MANDDGDGGVHESVAANMRAAAVTAMQIGERLAKAWADLARDAEQRTAREARLLAARIEAERTTATAALAVVDRPEWWERASVQEVAEMIEVASTWRDLDSAAARAAQTLDREIQNRYGITADALQQRTRAGQDRTEALEAITAADVLDRTAGDRLTRADQPADGQPETAQEQAASQQAERVAAIAGTAAAETQRDAGEVAYDSAERRDAFAAALNGSAETALVAGRVRADVNFAHPAEQATAVRGTSSASRGRPGTSPDRTRQRPPRAR